MRLKIINGCMSANFFPIKILIHLCGMLGLSRIHASQTQIMPWLLGILHIYGWTITTRCIHCILQIVYCVEIANGISFIFCHMPIVDLLTFDACALSWRLIYINIPHTIYTLMVLIINTILHYLLTAHSHRPKFPHFLCCFSSLLFSSGFGSCSYKSSIVLPSNCHRDTRQAHSMRNGKMKYYNS